MPKSLFPRFLSHNKSIYSSRFNETLGCTLWLISLGMYRKCTINKGLSILHDQPLAGFIPRVFHICLPLWYWAVCAGQSPVDDSLRGALNLFTRQNIGQVRTASEISTIDCIDFAQCLYQIGFSLMAWNQLGAASNEDERLFSQLPLSTLIFNNPLAKRPPVHNRLGTTLAVCRWQINHPVAYD